MSTALRTYYRGATLVGMRDEVAQKTSYYHFDHQGTTQCLTNENGAVTDRFACDAWGVPVKRTGSSINRQWYIGNLGYYRHGGPESEYVRARHYSPVAGRWLSVDPLRQGASSSVSYGRRLKMARSYHGHGSPGMRTQISFGPQHGRTVPLVLLSLASRASSATSEYYYSFSNPGLYSDPTGLYPQLKACPNCLPAATRSAINSGINTMCSAIAPATNAGYNVALARAIRRCADDWLVDYACMVDWCNHGEDGECYAPADENHCKHRFRLNCRCKAGTYQVVGPRGCAQNDCLRGGDPFAGWGYCCYWEYTWPKVCPGSANPCERQDGRPGARKRTWIHELGHMCGRCQEVSPTDQLEAELNRFTRCVGVLIHLGGA